ncbi:MAG: outer membrane beta-barrel protein [Litorimonas sp.]
MKIVKIAAATAAIAMIGGTAMAQDGQAYVGLGVDAVEFDSYNLSGKLGYNFNEFFGVESQGGFGIIDQEETIGGVQAEAGIDYYLSGFVTGRLPVSEQFELIGRAGYYFGEVEGSVGNVSVSEDIDGFAAGVGGQFNFGPGNMNGIRAEYTYLDVNTGTSNLDGDGDLYTISYIRKF